MTRNATACTADAPIYTIRKDGAICVTSSVPGCGYRPDMLRQLREAGYELYVNNNRAARGRPGNGGM